jgi:4-pyridoxate dehydrogenase
VAMVPPYVHGWFPGIKAPYKDAFGLRPAIMHPESRGEVTLRSADPRAPVRLQFNFLQVKSDIETLRKGLRIGRELARQKPMDPFRGPELAPGDAVRSDADIDAYIKKTVLSVHHPASTCIMGEGPDTVLDSQMRVRGVAGLRVVDASAMPDLVTAHINACVLMMAEKAADMIRGRATAVAA